MRRFSRLFSELDATTSESAKVRAIQRYFDEAPAVDAAWAVYLMSGRRPRRLMPAAGLREVAAEQAGLPDWLFDECYQAVRDWAETMALVLADAPAIDMPPLHHLVKERLLALHSRPEDERSSTIRDTWSVLDSGGRFIYNKLITGGFRVGISTQLLACGLSASCDVPAHALVHRLEGKWDPDASFFEALVSPDMSDSRGSRPYPLCLAHPLVGEPADLGQPAEWLAEWKWDGIRAQVIRRAGETHIWSRGGELITDAYPEVGDAARSLPEGTVLDGELLAFKECALGLEILQRRAGRKRPGAGILRDVPVIFLAFDVLETDGSDARGRPLAQRRIRLEEILSTSGGTPAIPTAAHLPLGTSSARSMRMSPRVKFASWRDLARIRNGSRGHGAVGLRLRRLDSPYETGKTPGSWSLWKAEALTVDAVLIYAQAGRGPHSGVFADYTFAVRDGDDLVPFAKADAGLTDDEIRELDQFVRGHTVERFGPVRSVRPELVFEIAFDSIRRAPRRKSGVAVRQPRINRWRRDMSADDIATLDGVVKMLSEERAS